MQVIKRDGKIVDFDKSKIRIAIEKANKESNIHLISLNDVYSL